MLVSSVNPGRTGVEAEAGPQDAGLDEDDLRSRRVGLEARIALIGARRSGRAAGRRRGRGLAEARLVEQVVAGHGGVADEVLRQCAPRAGELAAWMPSRSK